MKKRSSASKALILVMALTLAACGRGGVQAGSRAALTPDGGGNGGQGASGLLEKCANGQTAYGRVTEQSNSGRGFQQMVEDFVSATLEPSSIGTVSGQSGASTWVSLRLRLSVQDGQWQSTRNKMEILIHDSWVGQYNDQGQIIADYPVTLSEASQGRLDATARTFQIVFADAYGSVTLQGQWNDQVATGTVSFQNTKHVTNGTPAGGILGQFSVPTCSIF
ncbi:MAG: hypothetical protein KF802_00500 [Bdellovibrionaceae bacterium]|nr:hypothetical protein [Pseudobdellovibrionaceae bacterium]